MGAVVVAEVIAAVLLWPDRRPPVVVPDKPEAGAGIGPAGLRRGVRQ
ncbi:hypothetical protein [Thauera humireducens]